MSCKCDPSWGNSGECHCKNSPPLPAGSPRRALNPSICPRDTQCGSEFDSFPGNKSDDEKDSPSSRDIFTTREDKKFSRPKMIIPIKCGEDQDMDAIRDIDTSCVSLQYQRRAPCAKPLSPKAKKPRCPARGPEPIQEMPPCRRKNLQKGKRKKLPPGGRKSSERPDECATSSNVRVPCGVTVENYDQFLHGEKLRNREWADEVDCSSEYDSTNLSYRPNSRRHGRGKSCSSEKKRNLLKAKLRELLSGIEPIPESCLLESTEFKPEPEILAEVLFMTETEAIDLGEVKPDSVFDNLFADVSFEQPIAITNAAPGAAISDVVVPIHVSGQESASFEMPNIETVMENTRNSVPPKSNAFQQSTGYESFSSHMSELLDRSPTSENISEFLGASVMENDTDGTRRNRDSIQEYIIKPGQTTSGHSNRVRLNGSTKPIWFPGYIFASPNIPGCVRMTDDPGMALKEAWRLCRPQNFEENSRYIVDVG